MSEESNNRENMSEESNNRENILVTENLEKKFGGVKAIDNVSISVKKGEIRSVIGPNGAGKTTLFNLITGVLRPLSGKVYFKGKDITKLDPSSRVKLGISRSFQKINIFPNLSIKKNIDIASQILLKKRTSPMEIVKSKEIENRRREILERYQFEFERSLDEKAGTLPHAGQRRLEITMALASNPDLLLLDEPTAGMTDEETKSTMKLLKNIVEAEALILIEHDVNFVREISDKVTVLHKGQVIAEDKPERISEDEKVQEAYLGG